MTYPGAFRPALTEGREVVSRRDFERLETRPDGTVSSATRGHESVVERPIVPPRRTPSERQALTLVGVGVALTLAVEAVVLVALLAFYAAAGAF